MFEPDQFLEMQYESAQGSDVDTAIESEEPRYLATINTPGYLPWDDDPPVFDSAREAWEYLADHRRRQEDDAADEGFEGFSATCNKLESVGNGTMDYDDVGLDIDGTGSIHGDTPGYDGDHDLGLSYNVTEVEE